MPLPQASLQVVSDELAVTLNDARVVLEQYAEGDGGSQALERVGALLHTARGVLRMTETHGASLLAEEMEHTCAHLARLKRRDGGAEEPLEALMRATVQLPAYVEGVLNGGRDIPLVLLPLLNDLRAARGRPLLSESTLLLLNVGSESRAQQRLPEREPSGEDVCRLAHELRPRFQLALLGWIRGDDPPASLRQMYGVVERLERASSAAEVHQLWWVVAGILEALLGEGLETSVSLKRLMGQVDRELKRLRTLGEAQFAKVPPTELVNNLLYYVARARSAGPRAAAIRAAFNLADLVPGDAQVEQARQSLSAPSVKLMQTVAHAIREDLARVKDVLDIFVRTGMERVEELAPQLELLKKIGDTLGVLGLGELREKVQTRREELQELIAQGRRPEEAALIGIATALLDVEDRLEHDLVGMISPRADEPTVVAIEGPKERSTELHEVTAAVMRECLVNLARVKDAVSQVTERRGDGTALDAIPEQLQGIVAGLMMLGRERAAGVVEKLERVIRSLVREGPAAADRVHLDRLADATVSLEYYLETLQAGRSDPNYMLDNAERCLDALVAREAPAPMDALPDHAANVAPVAGPYEPTVVSAPVPAAADSPKLVFSGGPEQLEPELLELFIEEARDEIASIERSFLAWQRDAGDATALTNLRRSFHTLKGSGRMVGADVIGEFAWAVERLLNRIMDGTAPSGPREVAVLARAIDAVPALLEQLEIGAAPKQDIAAIMAVLQECGTTSGPVVTAEKEEAAAPPAAPPVAPRVESAKPAVQPEVAGRPAPDAAAEADAAAPATDPVLLDIFTREVSGHLGVLRRFIAACDAASPPYAVPEELYRSCHNLNGSVAMARVELALALTEALHGLIGIAHSRPARLPPGVVVTLRDTASRIEALLGWLAEPWRPVPDTADLVQRLHDHIRAIEQQEIEPEATAEMPTLADTDELAVDSSIVVEELAMPEVIELTGEMIVDLDGLAPAEPDGTRAPTAEIVVPGAVDVAPEEEAWADGDLHSEAAAAAGLPGDADAAAEMQPLDEHIADLAELTLVQPASEPEPAVAEPEAQAALEALTGLTQEAGRDVQAPSGAEADATGAEAATAGLAHAEPETADALGEEAAPALAFDPEIAAIFAEEAAELLDAADAAVAGLAESGIERDGRALADLQRYLHTLKGGARMAGLAAMGDFSHDLETLLIRVGDGLIAGTPALHELLQASLDELHRLREDAITGELRPLGRELAMRVRAALRGDVAIGPQQPVTPPTVTRAPAVEVPVAMVPRFIEEPTVIEPAPGIPAAPTSEFTFADGASHPVAVPPVGLPPSAEAAAVTPGHGRLAAGEEALVAPLPPESGTAGAPPEARAPEAETPPINLPALDRLGVLARELEQPAASAATPVAAPTAPAIARPAVPERRETARVDSLLLDQLLNNAGEISIFQSRLSQQVNQIQFNLEELGATVIRLREQLRKLELETEAQILFRHQDDTSGRTDFDPLELDRYSTIQQLSRGLAESATDVNSLKDLLQNMARDTEALLVQQARTATELQDGLMRTRMVPFQQHASRLARLVRQTATEAGKRAELHVQGGGELDRQVLERMLGPFEHMLRNAVIHGIELPSVREAAGKPVSGNIFVSLRRDGSEAVIEIADDGRGLDVNAIRRKALEAGLLAPGEVASDDEAMQFILRPGFSTADRLTQAAGRGIGMDVVTSEVARLGGSLRIGSVPGRGTTFTVRLPFTLAVTQALIVRVANELYALPLPTVEGVIRISRAELMARLGAQQPSIDYGGQSYHFRHLGEYLGLGLSRIPEEQSRVSVILVRAGDHSTALVTDEMQDSREIVVKPVGAQLATIRGVAGATILGDGHIAVILDVGILVRSARPSATARAPLAEAPPKGPLALVVDDSITMRRVTQRLLERNAFRVLTAKDGLEAIGVLQDARPDIILLDIEMPRMDGYEFAKHVRNNPETATVPIVMITSRVSDKHKARAIEVGVNDYLGKPYQERQLLEAVRLQLGQA